MDSFESSLAEFAGINEHSDRWTRSVTGIRSLTDSIQIGRLTLYVTDGRGGRSNALFGVSDMQEGVLCTGLPADSMIDGRRKAIAWSCNWLNQHA